MNNNDENRLIKMQIHRLDQKALAMEAKWGVGNLCKYASPDMKEKWNSQSNKLNDAVESGEYHVVRNLIDGTIRGWDVLESQAIDAGYKPVAPDYMEVRLDNGFHLRIAKNTSEARQCTAQGVHVWSIQEIARVIEKDFTLVNIIKEKFEGAEVKEVTEPFNFKKGDDIP